MGSNTLEKLNEIAQEAVYSCGDGGLESFSAIKEAVIKAYELGRNHKRESNKHPDDNPYHIDYKRQTKLEL